MAIGHCRRYSCRCENVIGASPATIAVTERLRRGMIARIVKILRQVAGAILPNVSRQITVSEWWALATVCAIAFVARVYRLETFPVNVTADEADNLKSAWRASATGVPGIFGFDWKPAPAFSIHVYRLFMAVFDDVARDIKQARHTRTSLRCGHSQSQWAMASPFARRWLRCAAPRAARCRPCCAARSPCRRAPGSRRAALARC